MIWSFVCNTVITFMLLTLLFM